MATATVNGNLPNGYTGNEQRDWEADDDSTPRSSGVGSPSSYEINYHGSCPKCHHLHTNCPFKAPRDPNVHRRFECEACQHPIFGIGRASTQTTLASVESIPIQRDPTSGTSRPLSLQTCVNVPQAVSQVASPASPDHLSAIAQLSTITEANTLAGRSRSTSNLAPPDLNSPGHDNSQTLSTGATPQASVREDEVPPSAGAEGYQQPQTQSSPRSRIKTLFLQGKRQFLRSSKYIRNLRHRKPIANLPIDPPDALSSKPGCSPRPAHSPTAHGLRGSRDTPDDELNLERSSHGFSSPDMSEEGPPLNLPTEQPQAPLENPLEPPMETSHIAEAPEDSEMHAEDNARARDVKRDRLLAKRREATLKSEATRRPVCECRPGCHCLGNDRDSDIDSHGHSRHSSLQARDIPEAPPHIMAGMSNSNHLSQGSRASFDLAGIGGHVDPSPWYSGGRISIAENSSSGAESGRLSTNRLSQATTLNDSSTSLAARRPSPLPRHRNNGRIALQNPGNAHQHRGSATDSGTARVLTRERAGSVSNDFNRDSSDESSTSLANRPDPGLEQPRPSQLSNPAVSFVQVSRLGETPEQSESQERTPRPNSYQAPTDNASYLTSEPALDQISTALENLEDLMRAQDNTT